MQNSKTKIVATIGPASEKEDILEKLIMHGIDAARLNFSHGSHEEQGGRIKKIRKISKKLNKHIAIIADIQGPKIRIGILPEQGVDLKNGQEITINAGTKEFVNNEIPLPSDMFKDGTKPGHIVFLDDGTLQIKILEKRGDKFKAIVLKGGVLFSKKGVNVPSLELRSSILNEKDKSDMKFASEAGADYIALSFLRNAADIKEAKKFLGKTDIKIIAKIERPEALVNLQEIVDEADAVMVARGDLGIETPLWELPVRQKEIVEMVRAQMKPVIVATQMLDSIIRNPIPTRAEVSDVANAVYDSADAVMLSGETANGRYPLEAVEIMNKILRSTERSMDFGGYCAEESDITNSVAHAATHIASEIGAKAIFTGAITGASAKTIAFFRPQAAVVAITNEEKIAQQLALVWGVIPCLVKSKAIKSAKDLLVPGIKVFKDNGFLKAKDKIVYRYHERLDDRQSANTLTVQTID